MADEPARKAEPEKNEDASDEPTAAAAEGEKKPEKNSEKKPRKPARKRRLILIAVLVVIVLLVAALLWWLNARHYEDTDDAFIDTHIVYIAPQIDGQVLSVPVQDNQLVQKGAPLVDIDPSITQARLNQGIAQQTQVQTQLIQAQAQIKVAEANYAEAQAVAAGAAAQELNAAQALARYRRLQRTNPAAVAQQDVDQAVATARDTAAQREADDKKTAAAAVQINAAHAALLGAQAQGIASAAEVASARLNRGYAHIVAPVEGHVTQRTVAIGNYVTPGQQLMALVPVHLWVTANFKETELDLIRPGQRVRINVDACPGADIEGHVDSIQRGAGQAFGILPPENATGNYVKVVQRVPVKILLDSVPKSCILGPGMSVEPSVRVR